MNDAIWKKNETYYFIVADYELSYWKKLLNSYNTEWKVLGKNLKGIFNDRFLDNYIEPTKGDVFFFTFNFNIKNIILYIRYDK